MEQRNSRFEVSMRIPVTFSPMQTAIANPAHFATLLDDGRVLPVGGWLREERRLL